MSYGGIYDKRYLYKDPSRYYIYSYPIISDEMLKAAFSSTENQLELCVTIGGELIAENTIIRVADRNKYVGFKFFHGGVDLPKIDRKMPDFLASNIQFSEADIKINNVDGRFNKFLIGGAEYTSFINSSIFVYLGFGEDVAAYKPIYKGFITSDAGVQRELKTFNLKSRDVMSTLDTTIPLPRISIEEFPNAPVDNIGKVIPLVLGDWTAGFKYGDPTIDPTVNIKPSSQLQSVSVKNIDESTTEFKIKTVEMNGKISGGIVGYYVAFINGVGSYFVISVGGRGSGPQALTYRPSAIEQCYIKRGSTMMVCNFQAQVAVTGAAGYYAVVVSTLVTVDVESGNEGTLAYEYQSGDEAILGVKYSFTGANEFGIEDSNPVNIAEEFLIACGRLSIQDDLDTASWDFYRNKGRYTAVPPQSKIYDGIKMRLWVGDEKTNVINHTISFLKQVRIEVFQNNDLNLALRSFHFEDYPPRAEIPIKIFQQEIVETSFKPELDKQNFFNSADGKYSFTPIIKGSTLSTNLWRNTNSIEKIGGKEISKSIDFPDLYIKADVDNQVTEYIRLFSAGFEVISLQLGFSHLLRDLGEVAVLTFNVSGVSLNQIVCQVRSVVIEPNGTGVELKLLSFGNFQLNASDTLPNQVRNLSSYNQVLTEVTNV